jgi:hypothetical protein
VHVLRIEKQIFSNVNFFSTGDKIDDDPLPNEDVSGTDSQDGHSHKEYITINVTNSEGQLTNFTNG